MSPQQATALAAALALVLLAITGPGCDPSPSGAPADGTGKTPTPTSASPSPSATPPDAPPPNPHAGSWEGSFKAAKADVEPPKGVPYKTWKSDDGKAHSGDGAVQLVVDHDGTVSGAITGALGDLSVRGIVEDNALRCGVTPKESGTEAGMHGTLVGETKALAIVAKLRVSSMDASIVRQAEITLKHK